MKISIKYGFCLLFPAFFFAGCNDNFQSSIPNYPVSLSLNLTTTYPTFNNSTNQILTFTKPIVIGEAIGYGGILVYSAPYTDDYGNSVYYAFDMSCPYEAKNNIRVYLQESSLGKVVCEKCGSVFDISFGTGLPESGPTKEPLKKYKTILSRDILYITR